MVSNSEIIIIIKSTIDIRSDGHFTSIIIKKTTKIMKIFTLIIKNNFLIVFL